MRWDVEAGCHRTRGVDCARRAERMRRVDERMGILIVGGAGWGRTAVEECPEVVRRRLGRFPVDRTTERVTAVKKRSTHR